MGYHEKIKDKLQQQLGLAQKKMSIASAFKKDSCAIKLDFNPGGTSNLGLGVIGMIKESDTKVTIAHAIYAETWTEEDGVALNKDSPLWVDGKIRQFLMWRMMQGMPKDVQDCLMN